MNEKPVKLPMEFGEALSRLARVPKTAMQKAKPKKPLTRNPRVAKR